MKIKSKILILLTATMLVIGIFPGSTLRADAASYEVSTVINGINCSRSTDFMVIYDIKGTYTETNIYGYEIVVTAGVVTSLGGNNSFIPNETGSFVVSGHGTAIDWLQKNVVLGMRASYTDTTVTFTYDSSTVLGNIKLKLDTMKSAYDKAKNTYRIIDYTGLSVRMENAYQLYNQLKDSYEANSSFDTSAQGELLIEDIDKITSLCRESSSVEIRGVWLRPTQTTTAAVQSYVKQLYDAGINMICIETLYNSTMIMPMPKDSLFVQNPLWAGFDMLQAYIDACHALDMELHIWMPVYYVGHGGSGNYNLSVGAKKPEWLSLTNTGEIYSPDDPDHFLFLSPANPEVKKFLLDTYEYILTKYDIDGFQLDYIRYAGRGSVDFGYDAATKNAFKAKYGITPVYNPKASYWNNWVAFRAGYVTDMVKSVRNLIDRSKPDVVLSADVSADMDEGYNIRYQDSRTWLKNKYLDMIHPMAYGDGYVSMMEDFKRLSGSCYLGVGLGAYIEKMDSYDMLRQAADMAEIKAEGSVFFEASSFLNKDCGSLLTSTLYRNRAVSPTFDEQRSVLLLIEQAITRINDVIIPADGMTSTEAENVKTKLDTLKASAAIKLNEQVITDINSAITSINTLTDEAAKQAVLSDLLYIQKITENAQISDYNALSDYFKIENSDGKNIAVGFTSGINNMTAGMAKTLLGGTVTVTDKNGSVLPDDKKLGTGCVLSNGNNSYNIVIKGDINGDGEIGSMDYLMTKRMFLGTFIPDNYQKRAAAITDGNIPISADYLKIKRHFLGTFNLYV